MERGMERGRGSRLDRVVGEAREGCYDCLDMKRYGKLRALGGFCFWQGITWVAAVVGSVASIRAGDFYGELIRPVWAPPASVFGPVWSALFVLMGVAAWWVWLHRERGDARWPLVLYGVQLCFNGMWSWLFFVWKLGGPAFVDILLLWLLIAATLVGFWRQRTLAGMLMVPYLLWVSFAAVLNFAVWRLNPGVLGGFGG